MDDLKVQPQGVTVNDLLEGYRETELGPLPEDWRVVRLREVIEQHRERAKDRSFEVMSCSKVHGVILQSQKFKRRVASKNTANYKVIQPGGFVYDPMLLWDGSIGRNDYNFPGVVSPAYYVFEGTSSIDALYLRYLLRSPAMIPQYQRISEGTNVRRRKAKFEDFAQIPVPLPSLPEQQAIAHVLRIVQEAKEGTEKVIEATRELKRSLMNHHFTYGPVPVDEAERVPLKETEIGSVPEHWEVIELGRVVTRTQYGLSQRGEAWASYPILRMNNLQEGRVNFQSKQYVDLDEQTLEKYKLRTGDLLFNRTNSYELVGKTALFNLDGDYVFASYLIRVNTDESRLDPSYANYYLNAAPTQARLKLFASRGVSQSNINATKLKSLVLHLPPLSEQREAVELLHAVDDKIAAEENRKRTLEVLFKTLLHNLMTGKIRVKDLDLSKAGELV